MSSQKVVLDIDTAREVLELIEDRPGQANEAVLDDALDALAEVEPTVPPDDQRRAASGEVVAMEVDDASISAVTELIERNVATRPEKLRRFGRRLQGKLASARHRRRSR